MRYVFGLLMGFAVFAFAACEDGDCADPVDVAGEWEVTSTVVSDNCDGRENQTFPMTIAQDANALTAVTPELELNGTICGNHIRMSGSFPDDFGTVTANIVLDVSADGQVMQGSDTWTWTDGFDSCSGSDSLSGTRAAACATPVADVTGGWRIDATPITDTCGGDLTPYTFFITAIQEGNAVTSQTPGGTMAGTICGDQLQMSLRATIDGETATVDMQLTVSADGNSAEGSGTWTWTNGAWSCGGSESLSATRIGPAVCGDNVVQPPEQCDGVDLLGLSCMDLGFTGGTLACRSNCSFDTSGCTGGPSGWTCPPEFYGTFDGCDCGCGVIDPDCIDGTVASCEYCDGPGSCSAPGLGCPGDIEPAQNWLCTGGGGGCVYSAPEHDAITCINGEAPPTDAGTVYFNAENCADAANTVYDLTLANADGVSQVYLWAGLENAGCEQVSNRSDVLAVCRAMAGNPRTVGDNTTVFDLTLQELVDTGIVDCNNTVPEGQLYEIYSFRNEDPGGNDVPPERYGVAPFKVVTPSGTGGSGGSGGSAGAGGTAGDGGGG